MNKATEYLDRHRSAAPSKWRDNAEWRRANQKWLKYARFITMRTMQAMEEQHITQSMLAERMGCSQQYVSNLLRGSSNMTLETIARIEDALNIDIIESTLTYVSGYISTEPARSNYLSDGEDVPYGQAQDI